MFLSKHLKAAATLATCLCLLSACSEQDHAAEKDAEHDHELAHAHSEFFDPEKIPHDAPTYVVGTMGSYAPFEFRDQNGQSIGFDIDVIYAIASNQKFNVSIVTHPWDGLLNTLNTGERDIVISTVNITPAREPLYDFTLPYFSLKDMILVKKENSNINEFTDLVANKSKIATLAGSNQAALLEQHGVLKDNILNASSQFDAVKLMFNDSATGVVGDGPVMEYFAITYPEYPAKSIYLPNAETTTLGIVVKKGNTKLRDQLNEGLKQIYADGTYGKIYNKWFRKPVPAGFLPWTGQ